MAAGITPLAHGNDIAGSVRYPAYACGLVGLRPSFGRVPAFNPSAGAERSMSSQLLSVQGPLARSVADLRLGLAAMAARDVRDPWWVPAPLEGEPLPDRSRWRWSPTPTTSAARRSASHGGRRAAAGGGWLADAGYEIVDARTPGFTRAMELWFAMQMPEIRVFLAPAIEQYGDLGIRRAMALWMAGAPGEDGAAYMKALAERARVVREWQRFLARVPLVLSPVCTEPVYRLGFDLESVERTAAMWRECATLTAVPVLGLPALAVPTGVVDGLPTGVQVMAAAFAKTCAWPPARPSRPGPAWPRAVPIDIAW